MAWTMDPRTVNSSSRSEGFWGRVITGEAVAV